jgi:hypothetical protein
MSSHALPVFVTFAMTVARTPAAIEADRQARVQQHTVFVGEDAMIDETVERVHLGLWLAEGDLHPVHPGTGEVKARYLLDRRVRQLEPTLHPLQVAANAGLATGVRTMALAGPRAPTGLVFLQTRKGTVLDPEQARNVRDWFDKLVDECPVPVARLTDEEAGARWTGHPRRPRRLAERGLGPS